MKTAEEILKKNCHIEKHPHAENQTVVYSHIDSVLMAMREYARLQIEKDRERVKAQNKDIYIVIDTVPIILD